MKIPKDVRLLMIFKKLEKGKSVNKVCEACEYGVSERTIQRHIDSIRDFLSELRALGEESSI